jgi:hypothetical protein
MLASPHAEAKTQHFVTIKYDIEPTLQACPSITEFRAVLERQLGYDPYHSSSPSGIWVSVRPTENGIEGTIDWSTPAEEHVGERRFASRSDECQKLIATIGFVVAVQIQLMDAEEGPGNSFGADSTLNGDFPNGSTLVKRETQQIPSVNLTLRHFDVRRLTEPDATQRAITVGMGPAVGIGLAPDPVILGRLFGAARFGWFGLETGIEYTLPSTTTESYGAGFRHALTLGTLAACGWFSSLGACGLTKVGWIQTGGFGLDRPALTGGFVAQIGPRVAYAVGLGNHFLLLGRIEALYLLTPWTVDLNHVAVWSMPRASAIAGIDLAASFP